MEWISVEDEMPADGCGSCSSCSEHVLIWTNESVDSSDVTTGWWCYGTGSKKIWSCSDGLLSGEHITHWMPLPNPPTT